MNVKPLGNRLLIKPVIEEKKTEGVLFYQILQKKNL